MKVIVVLPVVGLASAALAQSSARLDLMASADNGTTWHDYVACLPGAHVKVGLFISFDAGYGLGGCVYQIAGEWTTGAPGGIAITGAGLGRQAPFNFGGATQAVYATGNTFRIDAANDPNNNRAFGIATAQPNPQDAGPNFSTANPAFVYMFEVDMNDPNGQIVNLTTPRDQIKGRTTNSPGVVGVYGTSTSTLVTFVENLTLDGCTIDSYTPAPGSAALLLLGGVLARRRR